MAHLKELLKKKHVADNPLIKAFQGKAADKRKLRKSIAQAYNPETDDGDLADMFSKKLEDEENGLDGGDQKLSTLIYKASTATQDLFSQFNFPYPPVLKFLNTYGVKRAATDADKVVNAEIRLEAKIETQTGARRYLEIPVHIVRGSVIPPSIVYWEGREKLLTQGLVDYIIHTATAYAMEPTRENWASPLIDKQDMGMYTDMRNERGYQPRQYEDGFMSVKNSSKKRSAGAQEVFDVIFNDESLFSEVSSLIGSWDGSNIKNISADFQESFGHLDESMQVFDWEDVARDFIDAEFPETDDEGLSREDSFKSKLETTFTEGNIDFAIQIPVEEGTLFDDVSGIDTEASAQEFADKVTDAVEMRYPYADVEITSSGMQPTVSLSVWGISGNNDWEDEQIWEFEQAKAKEISYAVEALAGEIFEAGQWYVNTDDDFGVEAKRKQAIKKGVPSGWDTVIELLETAVEDGFMTVKNSQVQTTNELKADEEAALDLIYEAADGDDAVVDFIVNYGDLIHKAYVVSIAYETWTDEDLEIGETDDKGWEEEGIEEEAEDLIAYGEYYDYVDENHWHQTDHEGDPVTGSRTNKDMWVDNVDDTPVTGRDLEFIKTLFAGDMRNLDIHDAASIMYSSHEVEDAVALVNAGHGEDPNQLKLFASKREAIKKGVPSGWDTVIELLETAVEDGADTFPHAYHYVLRNYILEVLPCVDNNHWEIALVNAGWVINPYGRNRGRVTARKQAQEMDERNFTETAEKIADELEGLLNQEGYSHEEAGAWILENFPEATTSELLSAVNLYLTSHYNHTGQPQTRGEDITDTQAREMFGERLTASKRAQEMDDLEGLDDFELELEVTELPVEFADLETDLDLGGEVYDVDETAEDAEPEMLDWFYEGTKTPIEMNDNVKFEGNDGPIRSQIVEIQEDNNCVIVKSKGVEYRVHVEDISPLDSTFKKMYLARRKAQGFETEDERELWGLLGNVAGEDDRGRAIAIEGPGGKPGLLSQEEANSLEAQGYIDFVTYAADTLKADMTDEGWAKLDELNETFQGSYL